MIAVEGMLEFDMQASHSRGQANGRSHFFGLFWSLVSLVAAGIWSSASADRQRSLNCG